jgi:hypothetical protein
MNVREKNKQKKLQDRIDKRLAQTSRLANKCNSLFGKIQSRMSSVSPYTRRGQQEYKKKILSVNKMLENMQKHDEPKNLDSTERAKDEIDFTEKFQINLLKTPFFRKYLMARKNESYLFTFYKGKKDVNMHISINEEFKFKGLVYKKTNLNEVDFVFNNRYFDLNYKNAANFTRFHVHLRLKQKAKFNIIFKATLKEGRKKKKQNSTAKQVANYLVTD